MIKIRPCPLCGADNELIMIELPVDENEHELGLRCMWCNNGISVKGKTGDDILLSDVITKWNNQLTWPQCPYTMERSGGSIRLNVNKIQEFALQKGYSYSGFLTSIGMDAARGSRLKKRPRVYIKTAQRIADGLGVRIEDITIKEEV